MSILLAVCMLASWAQGSLQEVYQAGVEAYEAGDYPVFLSNMKRADELRPNHPTILYNLSVAYTLSEEKESAVATLRRVLWMNAELPYQSDEDLAALNGYSPFAELKTEIEKLKEPVTQGTLAFTIPDKELHPEGVAYSKKQKRFYVGGVHSKKIVAVDEKGNVTEFASGENLMAIMGLQVDDERNLLWVCSTPAPEMIDFEEGLVAEVLSFDIVTGKLVGSYSAPHPEAWLGDLLVSDDGVVYVTSSSVEKPAIYLVDESSKSLEVLLEPEGLISLQGLALNDDESILFFSDYRYGLFRYDLTEEKLTPIVSKINHPLKGIDGLYFYQGNLIAIHNGLRPMRIVRYSLNKAGDQILDYTFLEKAIPEMNEPTLGRIINGDLYYVTNSPWGAYDDNKVLQLERVDDPMIRKVKLKK